MSILTGPEIVRIVERSRGYDTARGDDPPLPHVLITPFDPALAGSNSYDVHLADRLRVYGDHAHIDYGVFGPEVRTVPAVPRLDPRRENPTCEVVMPPGGLLLAPGRLYLGATVERTQCSGLVPWLDGRSSTGRLGIQVHVTAGRGDDGWGEEVEGGCPWTLEITVTHPVFVFPGMRIGQLTFLTTQGERKPYRGRYGKSTAGDGPVASRFFA